MRVIVRVAIEREALRKFHRRLDELFWRVLAGSIVATIIYILHRLGVQ